MIRLELDDFGNEDKKPDLDKISKEEIEKFYQNKIKKIEEDFKKKIEQTKEESFNEGLKKGKEEAEKEFNKKLEIILNDERKKLTEQFEKEINELKTDISKLTESLKKAYQDYIDHINDLILSALEELLNYLYISPENEKFLSQQIISVINEFRNYPKLKITLSPEMEDVAKMLEKENLDVSIDNTLVKGDFRINIEDIQLESNFKEKIQILKDEIKREIKKHSKI